jgi:cytochrome c5
MKKITLLFGVSLALLIGCDSKESKAKAPNPLSVGADASKVAAVVTSTRLDSSNSDAKPDRATLSLGEKVYKSTCSICHLSGLKGAPRIGSKSDWRLRLTEDREILYQRAIKGYIGSKGSMPSRGSNSKLSEAEVKAAVDYMYEYAIPGWTVER